MHNIERMPLYALKKDSLPYVQGGGRMDGRMNKGTDRRMDEQSSRCSTGLHPLQGRCPKAQISTLRLGLLPSGWA